MRISFTFLILSFFSRIVIKYISFPLFCVCNTKPPLIKRAESFCYQAFSLIFSGLNAAYINLIYKEINNVFWSVNFGYINLQLLFILRSTAYKFYLNYMQKLQSCLALCILTPIAATVYGFNVRIF